MATGPGQAAAPADGPASLPARMDELEIVSRFVTDGIAARARELIEEADVVGRAEVRRPFCRNSAT